MEASVDLKGLSAKAGPLMAVPSWAALGVGMLPAILGYLGTYGYAAGWKGKKMSALENALLNLIGPLVDQLRAVEKERDTSYERNAQFRKEAIEHAEKIRGLEGEIKDHRKVRGRQVTELFHANEEIALLKSRLKRAQDKRPSKAKG
jgi:hypothetical protein